MSRTQLWVEKYRPTSIDDLASQEEVTKTLRGAIAQGQLPHLLMYGPPGTGKTLLARAVAHHTECTFIRVSGGELVQKYIGEGSRMVRAPRRASPWRPTAAAASSRALSV